ncbi:MAG: hypothetical protein KAR85_00990 [Methanosarcinales archaeon]|nr:hypothetical protein [Methanosarcinales archaeon]
MKSLYAGLVIFLKGFNEFDDPDIQPISFLSFFYCEKCASIASDNT